MKHYLTPKYVLGDIFYNSTEAKRVYYKIVKIVLANPNLPWSFFNKTTYNVIKCSKTGKEFEARNGFEANIIDNDPKYCVIGNAPVGEKASTINKYVGRDKRLLKSYIEQRDYLNKQIEEVTARLNS
jgi:hypothetical protein